MKFNWGTKLMLFFSAFVGLIIFMVVKSTQQKIDLVTTDYYEQELKYQEKIDQSERANGLGDVFQLKIIDKEVLLTYTADLADKLNGTIYFFRPSDENKDRSFDLKLGEGYTQSIDVNELSKGLYKVQIEWTENGESYFIEENFIMP